MTVLFIMKKIFLILFIFIVACKNSSNTYQVSDFVDSASVEASSSHVGNIHETPSGWQDGDAVGYTPKTQAEENLVNQVQDYYGLLLNGDLKGASAFFYPDAVKQFKDLHKDVDYEKETYEFLEDLSEKMMSAKKQYDSNGITVSHVVTDISNKVKSGSTLLYVYKISDNLKSNLRAMHTDEDVILGISKDSGKHWTFMSFDERTPTILRYSFNEDVINKVMDY